MLTFGEISLGPIVPKILPQIFNWRNDKDNHKNFGQFRPLSWEEHEKWYKSICSNPKTAFYIFGVGDNIVGWGGLFGIDRFNAHAYMSFCVISQYQEFEAKIIRALIHYAFKVENLNSVAVEVLIGNKDLMSIMSEYDKYPCMVPQRYWVDGKYVDSFLFTVVRSSEKWREVE